MKNYKGYYIDKVIFNSKADIDAFLKKQAIEAYKTACWLFAKNKDMDSSMYADQKAEILVSEFDFTWDQVEALEIEAYKSI